MVSPANVTTGVPTLLSISVIARVESVSNASRARSYMTFTLSMYCAGLAGLDRRGDAHDRLGFALPVARLLEAVLEVADAGEILVETAAVARADVAFELLRLVGDRVEDAASGVEPVDLRLDLLGRALQEELVENVGRLLFRRDGDAGARPREAAGRAVDGERERREPRERADALGDVLVERDGVAERAAGRVRRGGEEADVRRDARRPRSDARRR